MIEGKIKPITICMMGGSTDVLEVGHRIPITILTKKQEYILNENDDMIRMAELVKINKKSFQFQVTTDFEKNYGYLVRVKKQ